ncbi:hypothetical protein LOY28_29035 [Pseudomonas sp. B21-017]|uniref:hypothetical protein n=1 Tax=Pseudomonas sp. B21-017 TaxID=2895474 RepID=UPI00215E6D86|nr:hypothetical protein [Pseudomonas sp. B21-017]UVM38697.1 hypothetical protein LOY28_29035 [Pseudomonas sp. B21-017]
MFQSNSLKVLFAIGVFGVFISSAFAEEEEVTLCESQEDIYFSCPLPGGEIVSVCAFGNNKPSSGYVQYRYGVPEKLELTYPQSKVPPKGRFYVVNASEGSANLNIIKFYNGRYTYLVAQAFRSYLTVLKDGALTFRKSCEAGGYAFINRNALKGIEALPKSAEDFK